MSVLDKKHFKTEAAAFRYLENLMWGEGVVCPHCGSVDSAGRLKGVKDKKGRVRPGLWKCYAKECRKQFTVKVGTVFESMLIPLHKALQAVHLLCSSKKGISAHQLSRTLEVDYKSAWFLAHRIREAMRPDGILPPMGGLGEIVEADETFFGQSSKPRKNARGPAHLRKVMTLVGRGGPARSFHIEELTSDTIAPIVRTNIVRESTLSTDEGRHYRKVGKEFEEHLRVEHGDEQYVDGVAHVNSAEGFFSIFKRGMKGIYQHCSEKHLHRYLAEFDFRYSNRVRLGVDDQDRAARALKGIAGKRLTYRRTNETAAI
ncbi:MAG: IS1595 family transposase [Xanthobacteraceae bacterium]|jgi:transposase-like protein